ncbi:ABC transporter ATP-binding protein [Nocardioides carbamazepini]|uniref:ABC transporter ATP-binding protein n=1 Tax=Nocardioides carbamazepini TaxID=2854259 RepID=UPI002149C722|nr:ABC transporter ATP-binding protein [Nocardioides carbamazepini]MCR1781284.1 ABC transporter ATP-binding protein [Nocardioides carbamazepini]
MNTDLVGQHVLDINHLTVEFRTVSGWSPAVRDLSLTIGRNEVFGLVGESGSGKSVSAMSILGLLPRRGTRIGGGHVRLGKTDLLGATSKQLDQVRGSRVGMIFQEPMTSLNPAYTIGEQIAESVRRHRGATRRQAWDRAVSLLSRVGIPTAARNAERYPHHFSGGMRQRAMIAMALACEPELLIADEPTTALDVTVQALILDLIAELRAESDMSVLLITHDLAVVSEVADRVGVMYAGELVEQASTADVFNAPQHPYTSGLLSSILALDSTREFAGIPGSVPSVDREFPGCRFADRCAFATDACTISPVALRRSAGRIHRCLRSDELVLEGAR